MRLLKRLKEAIVHGMRRPARPDVVASRQPSLQNLLLYGAAPSTGQRLPRRVDLKSPAAGSASAGQPGRWQRWIDLVGAHVLEAAPDGIIVILSDGRILLFNAESERLFGYQAAEVVGENVRVLLPERLRAAHDRHLANADWSRILGMRREVLGRRKDGHEFPLDLHINAAEIGDGRLFVAVVSDISERRQAEQRLAEYMQRLEENNNELIQLRDQAEAANRVKTEFLANMSHEIRTPLTAILGFSDILANDQLSPSAMGEAVETIQRNSQHLLAVINDILDLSKIEAGLLLIERRSVALRELVRDVVVTLQSKADERGLAFEVEWADNLPEQIVTDPTRLRQILFNLLHNALKFTSVGEVRLSISQRGTLANPQLAFAVRDTGIGIPAERFNSLFKPFSQVDSSTTRKYGGTGLGLHISRRLAEMLGGQLNVVSSPGVGSTFTLCIDATVPPGKPADGGGRPLAATKNTQPLAGLRLLLAEDGLDNQRLVSHILHLAGATVDVVENGQLAVESLVDAQFGDQPYNLLLLDMQMPVLDGYGTVTALRTLGFSLPIIALTAHAFEEDRQRCLAAGCDDHFPKPVRREALIQLIASHVRRAGAQLQRHPG